MSDKQSPKGITSDSSSDDSGDGGFLLEREKVKGMIEEMKFTFLGISGLIKWTEMVFVGAMGLWSARAGMDLG